MNFRIVLFENAFESFPIGLIPIYLPQKCMVQSRLMYLTGFITHAQVFHMASHQLTYSHMLDELYTIIFSVLSAKKSWFHCFNQNIHLTFCCNNELFLVLSKFLPHIGYYHMYGFLFLEYIYIPNLIHLKFLPLYYQWE